MNLEKKLDAAIIEYNWAEERLEDASEKLIKAAKDADYNGAARIAEQCKRLEDDVMYYHKAVMVLTAQT